LFNILVMMLQP